MHGINTQTRGSPQPSLLSPHPSGLSHTASRRSGKHQARAHQHTQVWPAHTKSTRGPTGRRAGFLPESFGSSISRPPLPSLGEERMHRVVTASAAKQHITSARRPSASLIGHSRSHRRAHSQGGREAPAPTGLAEEGDLDPGSTSLASHPPR